MVLLWPAANDGEQDFTKNMKVFILQLPPRGPTTRNRLKSTAPRIVPGSSILYIVYTYSLIYLKSVFIPRTYLRGYSPELFCADFVDH